MPGDLTPAPTPGTGRQEALLAWADLTRRDLPWRRTRDPWAVLVSELMLQQTQVARVIPKFHQFLERFPVPADCAVAPVGEVIQLWAGLGYNRRAVNLHGCAVDIVAIHGGTIPNELSDLMRLPGIGPYTGRAVLAFAFERDVGVLDTNAARVLARWSGQALGRADAQRLADESVPAGAGWAWNQAMLDLGATVCTARSPRCSHCAVAASCAWAQAGRPDPDPAIGSAGVSGGQSTFDGSDRQGRGRLVDVLRTGRTIPVDQLSVAAGWPTDPERAYKVAVTLVADGLAVWSDEGDLVLPA